MNSHLPFDYEVIVVGAGAAGLSAALWCAELKFKTVVLEAENRIGGQLHRVYNSIENHLGTIAAANGAEMAKIFAAQIEKRDFEIRFGARVAAIDLTNKRVELTTAETLTARALVLATGVSRRKLNVAGEDRFQNAGILESGKRDAALVRGQTVCIVGGGDAACENAVILAETAARVFLVHRRAEFRARREFLDQIFANPKIEVLTDTEVLEILGDKRISGVRLRRDGEDSFEIRVDALLLRIGVAPNTALFTDQIRLDANGYIAVNQSCETSVENVFGVGDVANPLAPTVSTAIGMGATAAKVLRARLPE